MRALPTTAAVVVVCAASAAAFTGGGAPYVVARVHGVPITHQRFEHWALVAARSDYGMRHVPRFGSRRWPLVMAQTMQFLLSAQWILGEARRRGLSVTDAAVRREFVRTRRQSFPKLDDYRRFLRKSGMTENDIVYRVRLDLLSNRLRALVVHRYATSRDKQAALDRYVGRFQRRWKSRTSCRIAYRTADCGRTLG